MTYNAIVIYFYYYNKLKMLKIHFWLLYKIIY